MSCGKHFLAFRLSVRFKLSQEEGLELVYPEDGGSTLLSWQRRLVSGDCYSKSFRAALSRGARTTALKVTDL